jgi:hypothetical protein
VHREQYPEVEQRRTLDGEEDDEEDPCERGELLVPPGFGLIEPV